MCNFRLQTDASYSQKFIRKSNGKEAVSRLLFRPLVKRLTYKHRNLWRTEKSPLKLLQRIEFQSQRLRINARLLAAWIWNRAKDSQSRGTCFSSVPWLTRSTHTNPQKNSQFSSCDLTTCTEIRGSFNLFPDRNQTSPGYSTAITIHFRFSFVWIILNYWTTFAHKTSFLISFRQTCGNAHKNSNK